jgi:hypothetical protein
MHVNLRFQCGSVPLYCSLSKREIPQPNSRLREGRPPSKTGGPRF